MRIIIDVTVFFNTSIKKGGSITLLNVLEAPPGLELTSE
jgi:hypothetical protein